MPQHETNKLHKEPFTPNDRETALYLTLIFPKYYSLIRLIKARYRKREGLRPAGLLYLCLLYAYPDGLTTESIKEILNRTGSPYSTLMRLMSLGYIERTKGRKRGGYNMTPDIYYLSLSGVAVVESLLNAIKR